MKGDKIDWVKELDKRYTNRDTWYDKNGIKDREVCGLSRCRIKYPIKRSQWFNPTNPTRTDWTIPVEEYGVPTQLPIAKYNETGVTCTRGTDTTIFIPWYNVKAISFKLQK